MILKSGCSAQRSACLALVLVVMIFLCGPGVAQDGPSEPNRVILEAAHNRYVFDLPWDAVFPRSLGIESAILDAPAGKYGRLIAEGDRLLFSNGTTPRFWGVGVTFSSSYNTQFPPDDKDIAQKVVDKIATHGFNHVRMVGLDGSAPEIVDTWLNTGSLDCSTLDKLDYFISLLRAKGIYYSFSINNHANRLLDHVKGAPVGRKRDRDLKRHRYMRLMDDSAIDAQVAWYKAFYSHVNPYTNLTYAEDPANLYVSAINEDSVSLAYFRSYDKLDAAVRHELNDQYRQFLAAGHVTVSGDSQSRVSTTLPSPSRLETADVRTQQIVAEFLFHVDYRFASRMKSALKSVGYDGLFTFNNNWAGYTALLVDHDVGDYVELHSYFDHPKRRDGYEQVLSRSLIKEFYPGAVSEKTMAVDWGNPFNRFFMSLLTDRPLIISEWNQSAWSDRPYEGLVLMAAYAAFQGVQLLDAHTFFSHPNPDPRARVATNAFAVGQNPVWMALSPSLALAFTKGYLQEGVLACIWNEAPSRANFFQEAGRIGLRHRQINDSISLNAGYTQKIRKRLISKSDEVGCGPVANITEGVAAGDGRLQWTAGRGKPAMFSYTSSRFVMFAGETGGHQVDLGPVKLILNGHGAVTAITLDDLPLSRSRKILVTAVSSFQNTGWDKIQTGGKNILYDAGSVPVRVTSPRGVISITSSHGALPRMYAVSYADSRLIDGLVSSESNGSGTYRLPLGSENSPWMLLTK